MAAFKYQEIFEHGPDTTAYRQLTSDYVSTTTFGSQEVLKIVPEALTLLARDAMDDVAHLLRASHLKQLAKILDDPEASDNDRFVALELLKNANIAAGRVLPGCQDTGTLSSATKANMSLPLGTMPRPSRTVFIRPIKSATCATHRWRHSICTQKKYGTNLPAQIIEIYA